MATIGLYHNLSPGSEGLAGVSEEVHEHVGPFHLNSCFQGGHTGMTDGAGLPLKFALYTKVKGLQSGEDGGWSIAHRSFM